jgi:hypothetical protein
MRKGEVSGTKKRVEVRLVGKESGREVSGTKGSG